MNTIGTELVGQISLTITDGLLIQAAAEFKCMAVDRFSRNPSAAPLFMQRS